MISSGEGCVLKDDVTVFDSGVLLHHDGVRAARDCRAGHDLDASARLDRTVECDSGAAFADQAELCTRLGGINGAQSESVAGGSIEWRVVAIR